MAERKDLCAAARCAAAREKRWKGAAMWVSIAAGCWMSVLYWSLFGWIGAVGLSGAYTLVALLVGAYALGSEADNA